MYCMLATCLCTARQYHTRPPRRYHALWSPLWPHVESHHCVRGRSWLSRTQPQGEPSCALASARGEWRLCAGALEQHPRTVPLLTRRSANGTLRRRTCQRSSWTAGTGYLGRSSSRREREITQAVPTCCQASTSTPPRGARRCQAPQLVLSACWGFPDRHPRRPHDTRQRQHCCGSVAQLEAPHFR